MTNTLIEQARRVLAEAQREERLAVLTVKEYAAQQRVTERTVRTWISKRAVRVRRTPGRQIRVVVACED